jgi:hypothetical protein
VEEERSSTKDVDGRLEHALRPFVDRLRPLVVDVISSRRLQVCHGPSRVQGLEFHHDAGGETNRTVVVWKTIFHITKRMPHHQEFFRRGQTNQSHFHSQTFHS